MEQGHDGSPTDMGVSRGGYCCYKSGSMTRGCVPKPGMQWIDRGMSVCTPFTACGLSGVSECTHQIY